MLQGKVEGEAQGEKHLDADLNKQSLPKGATELKQVSLLLPLLCDHSPYLILCMGSLWELTLFLFALCSQACCMAGAMLSPQQLTSVIYINN